MCNNCPICKETVTVLAIIPMGHELVEKNALACTDCMRTHSIWCDNHHSPFTAWSLGGFFCMMCLRERWEEEKGRAEDHYANLILGLLLDEARALTAWAKDPDNLFALIPLRTGPELVTWSLCGLSLTRSESLQDTLKYIMDTGNLEQVIPQGFPASIPDNSSPIELSP